MCVLRNSIELFASIYESLQTILHILLTYSIVNFLQEMARNLGKSRKKGTYTNDVTAINVRNLISHHGNRVNKVRTQISLIKTILAYNTMQVYFPTITMLKDIRTQQTSRHTEIIYKTESQKFIVEVKMVRRLLR